MPATAISEDGPGPANEVRLDLGVFAPTGFVGALYNRRLIPHLELEAGVGLGFSGVQLSMMPKLTFGSPTDMAYTGAGVALSFGNNQQNDVWLNLDVIGYEHRFESGFVLNVGVGWFWGLSGTYQPFSLCISDSCSTPQPKPVAGYNLPQAHLGVGYAF